jgi:hypothetical protein
LSKFKPTLELISPQIVCNPPEIPISKGLDSFGAKIPSLTGVIETGLETTGASTFFTVSAGVSTFF